jgi:hypothetical protein
MTTYDKKLLGFGTTGKQGERVRIGAAARVGAMLFVLWGILHVWVGFAGIQQYVISGATGLWYLLTGGANAPHAAFKYATDALTANAQAHLLLNFCIDVGGYGVLALVVAWWIWVRGSWSAYLIGVVIIGLCDLTFLFSMVTPGIVQLNPGTISGPVIWLIACLLTPFGLPSFKASQDSQ